MVCPLISDISDFGLHSCIRENANAAQHLRQLRALQTLPWALGILADSGMGRGKRFRAGGTEQNKNR